jgi:hypothetical protein
VELQQARDVDVGDAVAVGEHERVVADPLAHSSHAPSRLGIGAGVDQVDDPILGRRRVGLEPAGAEIHGHVGRERVVVGEVLLDHRAEVAEGDDELVVALRRVDVHDVPDHRVPADLDEGLRLDVRLLA